MMKVPETGGGRGPGGFSGSCGRSDTRTNSFNRGPSVGRWRRSGPSVSDWGCRARACTLVWSHTREDPE